jgi:putative tricarboxylic transport membrane protein
VSGWKSLDKSELVGALLLAAFGAYIAAAAWEWPYLTKDGPGPGFFPLWIGISMIGLSAALVVLQLVDIKRGRPVHRTSWKGAGPVVAGCVALVVAAALLKPAGFLASYTLLTIFLVRAVFRQSWTAALTVSLVSAVAFWILFVKLLRVQLPAGPWGF